MRTHKNFTRYLLIFNILLATVSSRSQTPVPGGNVSGVWSISGSPYQVQGSIMIPEDSMLTILPGVTVTFQGHFKFVVKGRLLAIGSDTAQIIITASDQSVGWYGLRFNQTSSTSDSSILEYCTLSYGRATEPDDLGGAISIDNFSKIRISRCLIEHNYAQMAGGGIFIEDCDPVITENVFDGNIADFVTSTLNGGGGICLSYSNSRISGNTFRNNSSSSGVGGGAGIFFMGGSPEISSNIIINNSNTNDTYFNDGGGGGIFADGSANIINNTISNNSSSGHIGRGGGIYFYWNDNSILTGNTITNNTANGTEAGGGAIFCLQDCDPVITNNTIANNLTSGNGGALYCYSNSSPVFRNCIIWGNVAGQDTNQVYLFDEDSDPDFYYCDIRKGVDGFDLNGNFYTGNFENNLDCNPLFAYPSQGSGTNYDGVNADWALVSPSPCINSGDTSGTYPPTDKAGNPRVINGIIDMGPYEYLYVVGITETVIPMESVVTPNPFIQSTIIQFSENISTGQLLISDVTGHIIKTITGIQGDRAAVEREGLSPGMYFYKLMDGNRLAATGKLIVL